MNPDDLHASEEPFVTYSRVESSPEAPEESRESPTGVGCRVFPLSTRSNFPLARATASLEGVQFEV
jgi:hypothetical protein